MTAQAGRDFTLYLGTVASLGAEIADMRTTSFRRNGEMVDVTTKDSNGKRTLLAGAGVTSLSVSATGVISDNDQIMTLDARCEAMSIDSYVLVFADGDKIELSGQITQFEAAGEYNGEQTYNLSIESSGATTQTTV
jgi:TP901-1 family phage major tail protein